MFKLFSGSAHPSLTDEVVKLLKTPLAKSEVVRFGNSEVKVTIQEDVKNLTCVVIQPTTNPTDTNLIEMAFFCDALRRCEAKEIIGIIPYFGYAKQNIQHRLGECVSVNVVVRLLESVGFHKIYTFDIHDEATGGIFSIPFVNMSAFDTLAKHVSDFLNKEAIDLNKIALVSPDQGAVEKVRRFGQALYGSDLFSEVVIEKKRDQNIMHKAEPLDLYGDVRGKIVIIVDDMVVSGSTLIPATDLCIKRGATKVYAAVIHHDFTKKAPQIIQNSKIERFFTTNTIPLRTDEKFPKLEEISVAPLIYQELQQLAR